MARVTIFCTITSVGAVEAFIQQQVSGHKFVLTAKDDTQSQSITVFDHTREYHHSLYVGQSIMLENAHTPGNKQKEMTWPQGGGLVCGLVPVRLLKSPGEVLPYMSYIGMCRCEGYGFQRVYSRIGYHLLQN